MNFKKFLILLLISSLIAVSCSTLHERKEDNSPKKIAIAWRSDTSSDAVKKVYEYLSSSGSEVFMLGKTTTTDLTYYSDGTLSDDWLYYDFSLSDEAASQLWHTDSIIAPEGIEEADLIVFTGGEDISPSLYGESFLLDEPIYNPERDASDFLTMRYAIENGIPVLGICRGMQMLGVVEGASLIPDLPEYFESINRDELKYAHRTEEGSYTFHDIEIEKGSLLDGIIYHPIASSHHQALDPEEMGNVKETASYKGIAEAVEVEGDAFIKGIQFHPEYFIWEKESDGLSDSLALLKKILEEI